MALQRHARRHGIKKRVPWGTRLFPKLRNLENQSADSIFSAVLAEPVPEV